MITDNERRPTSDGPDEGSGDAMELAEPTEATEATEERSGPITATELLRTALVDDEDPRFPAWLPIPGALLGLGWAGYQATAGDAGFLPTLGISFAIFAGTTLATWLGWQLEID